MKSTLEQNLYSLLNCFAISLRKFFKFWIEPMNFHVDPKDVKKLQIQRFTHPHPLVRRLLHALYYQGIHLSISKTCRYAGISPQALRLVRKIYKRGGLEELKRLGSRIPYQAIS